MFSDISTRLRWMEIENHLTSVVYVKTVACSRRVSNRRSTSLNLEMRFFFSHLITLLISSYGSAEEIKDLTVWLFVQSSLSLVLFLLFVQFQANFYGEFEIYKARLHKSYPLCSDCELVVQKKLELDKVALFCLTCSVFLV